MNNQDQNAAQLLSQIRLAKSLSFEQRQAVYEGVKAAINLDEVLSTACRAHAIDNFIRGPHTKDLPSGYIGHEEQKQFELFALREQMNCEMHPLHYLFMDPQTNAARRGWNAALKTISAFLTNQVRTDGSISLDDDEQPAPAVSASTNFQQQVSRWITDCFGDRIAMDWDERNQRFIEEAIELVQACRMTREDVHRLVDYVYDRPRGDKQQEVGGVMVTLAALCNAQHIHMMSAADAELQRCWKNIEKIREKQANKPKNSPLPEHVPERITEGYQPQAAGPQPEPPTGGSSAVRDNWQPGNDGLKEYASVIADELMRKLRESGHLSLGTDSGVPDGAAFFNLDNFSNQSILCWTGGGSVQFNANIKTATEALTRIITLGGWDTVKKMLEPSNIVVKSKFGDSLEKVIANLKQQGILDQNGDIVKEQLPQVLRMDLDRLSDYGILAGSMSWGRGVFNWAMGKDDALRILNRAVVQGALAEGFPPATDIGKTPIDDKRPLSWPIYSNSGAEAPPRAKDD